MELLLFLEDATLKSPDIQKLEAKAEWDQPRSWGGKSFPRTKTEFGHRSDLIHKNEPITGRWLQNQNTASVFLKHSMWPNVDGLSPAGGLHLKGELFLLHAGSLQTTRMFITWGSQWPQVEGWASLSLPCSQRPLGTRSPPATPGSSLSVQPSSVTQTSNKPNVWTSRTSPRHMKCVLLLLRKNCKLFLFHY